MPWFRRTRNLKRSIRKKPIGFVHLELKNEVPQFLEPRSFVQKKIFPDPPHNFIELWKQSERLLKEKRVKGLIMHIRSMEAAFADYESFRDLIALWQDNGRPVWVYANGLNFFQYYLACKADKIFIRKGGVLDVKGISLGVSFFKDFLDKRGIEVQVVHVSDFKSAGNSLIYNDMPDDQRENLEWLSQAIYDKISESIAEERGKTIEKVHDFIDHNPMSDTDANEGGWIDGIIENSIVREKIQSSDEVTDFKEALGRIPMPKGRSPNIAIIPVKGTIIDGESRNYPVPVPIFGDEMTGDLTVVQLIRKVRESDKIKAAILYVDSGGGSATSSESMLDELGKLAKEKPLVAYFHNVAASGGYYVAMNAQKIICQPLTITGSIGVINAKFSWHDAYEDRKINRVILKNGKNSDINDNYTTWDEDQIALMENLIFRIYDVFLDHVSNNRELDKEELEKNLAGGRVWSGIQGLEHNLIDEVGNLITAIESVAELADIKNPEAAVISTKDDLLPPAELPEMVSLSYLKDQMEKVSGKPHLIQPYVLDFQY